MKPNCEKEGLLTSEQVRTWFAYDAQIGRFRWKQSKKGVVVDSVAGGDDGKNGYRSIKINFIKYLEHRLVWFFHNGKWPKEQIDHINGNRQDNRLENLREVTRSQNAQNIHGPQKNGRSGYLGVAWHAPSCRWRASIQVDGRRRGLGQFESPEQAHEAYLKAKKELHPFSVLGAAKK